MSQPTAFPTTLYRKPGDVAAKVISYAGSLLVFPSGIIRLAQQGNSTP
jgi:hypothetical protein